MVPLVFQMYFGEVTIEFWEYLLAFAYGLVLYIYFSRKKNQRLKEHPEYQYFLWGLLIKMVGGVVFSNVYFFYYPGGDTMSYFYGGVAMGNLAWVHPFEYLRQMLGDNSYRAWLMYTLDTKKPFEYMFYDDRTFFVLRVVSVLAFLTLKSYLTCTVVIASLSYFGIWSCYRTFVSYFPSIQGRLAIAFLFMPSVVFWGSSILKDTFTFAAVCWWVHAVDELFFKKRNIVRNAIVAALSMVVMIGIKPYIFMVLMPATLLWLTHRRIVKIRSSVIKFMIAPAFIALTMAVSILLLNSLGDKLGKFSLDNALEGIEGIQGDLLHSEGYSDNKFDIGEFNGTWWGVLSKFPVAVNATLFRPYIWEARSVVIMMSALENLCILCFVIYTVLKVGPRFLMRAMLNNSLILMSMTFALLFSFVVGITTPNFGAMVRFKIPMLPFLMSSLFIILHLYEIKTKMAGRGRTFQFRDFRDGSGHIAGPRKKLAKGGRNTRGHAMG
ncbi:MAG: hypothetical protein ABIQ75_05930 [Flavobacteriales bacterium]